MKKGLFVHFISTVIYLIAFLYVTDGIQLKPILKALNVFFLFFTNFIVSIICLEKNLYKDK